MGKFSDYVSLINEQTNTLRENLTNATGVDCSKKSIGGCADVVADYVPDLEKEEVYYDRPSWYPDIKAILNSAPEIEKDGDTYVPAYIMLFDNLSIETPFYFTHSTIVGDINYYKSTGGNAVLCSDKCDNNIINANADTLEVGATLIHTWNTSKDIADPSGNSLEKVRWAIIYQTVTRNNISTRFYSSGWNDCIEIITGNTKLTAEAFGGVSNSYNSRIKYIEIQENTIMPEIGSAFTGHCSLEVLIINNVVSTISTSFVNCNSLKYIKFPMCSITNQLASGFPALKKIDFQSGTTWGQVNNFLSTAYNLERLTIPKNFAKHLNGFRQAYSLKELIFEGGVDILSTSSSSAFCESAINLEKLVLSPDIREFTVTNGLISSTKLKYLKIPSSIEVLTLSSGALRYTTYIELFNDFNISAVNFNSGTGPLPKDLQWLRDLCIWLKDRTGDTANTMIIGSVNLENAQNLWLTFNPNDKRDITWVDAGTEGAINIVEFITTQLNWTLS